MTGKGTTWGLHFVSIPLLKMEKKIKLEDSDSDIVGTGTQFNFAQLYYISLDKVMLKKEECAINGDLNGWYHALQVMYRRMCFKINPDALNGTNSTKGAEIEAKFKIASNGLLRISSLPQYNERLIFMQSQMVSSTLHDIDKELWYLLDKNRMIFPKFKQMHGLKTYANKLKLGDV